jgi:hypothetical protein
MRAARSKKPRNPKALTENARYAITTERASLMAGFDVS